MRDAQETEEQAMKWIRRIGKGLLGLVTAAFCLGLLAAAVFGVKGYLMAREALEEKPPEQMAEEICSMEHFTSFDELPELYVKAVVAAEDQRFWTHGGYDLIAIGRAIWNDLRTLSFVEGGSTITQQLAKNQYFTQEKRLERKFAEIFAAVAIENVCSKQEILECYVNTIYFGSGYYGIYDAAMGYYGKEPSELTDAEAVMLAGLPNAPSVYSPDVNPELAGQRMRQVIRRMTEQGVLSQEEAGSLLS